MHRQWEDFLYCLSDKKAQAAADGIPGVKHKLRQRGRVLKASLCLYRNHHGNRELKRKRCDNDDDLEAPLDRPVFELNRKPSTRDARWNPRVEACLHARCGRYRLSFTSVHLGGRKEELPL